MCFSIISEPQAPRPTPFQECTYPSDYILIETDDLDSKEFMKRPHHPERLDPNSDPIVVGPPKQLGYGQWLVTRMRDVRTVLVAPETTVDLLTPKAILRAQQRDAECNESTLAILHTIGRTHRQPNDAERRDAIAITRLFQSTLADQDLQVTFTTLRRPEGATVDVMNAVIRPILGAWRATALGIDSILGQRIEDGLLSLILELEKQGIQDLALVEPLATAVLQDMSLLASHCDIAREMPVQHWISPAFLAILPLAYTSVSMLAHLADSPELQGHLRLHRERRADYLHEVERLMNASRYLRRQIGAHGLDLGDVQLPPRSLAVLDCTAANRDPEVWPNPDLLQLDRAAYPSASYAFGPLGCTGAQLSRVFLVKLLDAVLDLTMICTPVESQAGDRLDAQWSMMRGYRSCRLMLRAL